MSEDQNRFGGGNPHALYVPMSEDEQEVLARLVESQTLRIRIHGWPMSDIIPRQVSYGDKRVQVVFQVWFQTLAPAPTPYLDIELLTTDGFSLMRKLYPTMGAKDEPLMVVNNMTVDLKWDIAIDHMDPALVKAIKPGALGLTTKRLDRDTGNRTLTGNMKVGGSDQEALHGLEQSEAYVRTLDPATIKDLASKVPSR